MLLHAKSHITPRSPTTSLSLLAATLMRRQKALQRAGLSQRIPSALSLFCSCIINYYSFYSSTNFGIKINVSIWIKLNNCQGQNGPYNSTIFCDDCILTRTKIFILGVFMYIIGYKYKITLIYCTLCTDDARHVHSFFSSQ